jgi:hypothetical protein
MADSRAPAQLIRFRPRPDHLIRLIRQLAAAGRVGYLDHSLLERMPERGFDTLDVLSTLKTGVIVGPIDPGLKAGEWKVKIVSSVDGTSRKMGVVVILVRQSRILIKTTEWEDK